MLPTDSSASKITRDERSLALYQLLCGLFGIVLLLVTWQLWLPGNEFPKVPTLQRLPLLGSPAQWPSFIDYVALSFMIAGFVAMAISSSRWLLKSQTHWYVHVHKMPLLFAIGFCFAALIDQHRLQPWAVQFLPLSFLFAGYVWPRGISAQQSGRTMQATRSRLRLARLLVLGIYFWSAISKIDYQFAYTVGSEMLTVPASWLGVDIRDTDPDVLAFAALALPLIELLAVALLCFHRTRIFGSLLALCMHSGLIATLGPLGLNHQPGVLLWNLFSIFQVWLLFGFRPRRESPPSSAPDQPTISTQRRPGIYPTYSASLIVLMLVLPIGERWGYYDHWPSWALYAPHSSRVTLLVPTAATSSLPEAIQPFVSRPLAGEWYVNVRLDRWSLEQFGAPIYPQARYQLGVAIEVVKRAGLDRQARVLLRGPSNRLTGARDSEELIGLHAMKKAGERFWLNALPASELTD